MESIGRLWRQPFSNSAYGGLVAGGGAGFGLDIRRLRTWDRRRTRFINLRFKIGRFLNQDGSKLRVCGFLGKFEKRRNLPHEIIPTQHDVSPRYARPAQKLDSLEFGSAKCAKVNLGNSGRSAQIFLVTRWVRSSTGI